MKHLFTLLFVLILLTAACDSGEVDAPAQPAPISTVSSDAEATAVPQPPAEPVTDKWELWTGGTHLRGVDMHPCLLYTEAGCEQPMSRQDVQDLRDLGANLINASYPGLFTEKPPYELDPTALAYLDDLIGWAEEVGFYVVIHFRTGPGRNEAAITLEGDPLFAVWTEQEAHDAWVEMWRFTAERYRHSPAVVGYDLMVEPHPNSLVDPDYELEPAEAQAEMAGTLLDWNALAAEITAVIRQVDPDTPIIINSLSWGSAEWFAALQPTGDPRTVYSLHAYDPDIYVIQEEGESNIRYPDEVDDYGETITFDRDWLAENYRPVREFAQQYNVPIYVGEFGALRWVPDATTFLYDQMDLFEQYGWNYAVYVWRGDEPDFDGFNLEYGLDPDNHTPLPDNPLLRIFRDRWALNVDFPNKAASTADSSPTLDFAHETREDGAVRLTDPPAGVSDQNAAFAPDGTRLVFTRFENGYNIGPAGVFILDLTSGHTTRLTPEEDQDNVNLPGSAWNAVNDRIVFASDRGESDDLWRVAADGTDFSAITAHDGPPWYIEPSWSPDGQWIVFEADNNVPDDRQQGSIRKVRADGSDLTPLTDGPANGVDDRQPNWSPTGDRILFQRHIPGSEDWNVFTMTPDGRFIAFESHERQDEDTPSTLWRIAVPDLMEETAVSPAVTGDNLWRPALDTTWQWQLSPSIDDSFDVDMYDIDLFDNDADVVADLHAQGRKVVCYISVGSWEDWRPDKDQFPDSVIGNAYDGWPGENWLDIRQIDLLAPIMRTRLDACRAKGFDGIEPDNIDSYTNDTGFPLTYQDQLNYNIWLAKEAHARGLSIGLKNDGEQVVDLLPYFDWALTEDCFDQEWCEEMLPFIAAGKPVFAAEYTDTGITLDQFCPQARAMNFNAILKNRDLDAWMEMCP